MFEKTIFEKGAMDISNYDIEHLSYSSHEPRGHIKKSFQLRNNQTCQTALFTLPELPTWGLIIPNSATKTLTLPLQFPTMVEASPALSSAINGLMAISYKIKRDIRMNNWIGLKSKWFGAEQPYSSDEISDSTEDAWDQHKFMLTVPNKIGSNVKGLLNIYNTQGERLFPDNSLSVTDNGRLLEQLLCFRTKITATVECQVCCFSSKAYIKWILRHVIISNDKSTQHPIASAPPFEDIC